MLARKKGRGDTQQPRRYSCTSFRWFLCPPTSSTTQTSWLSTVHCGSRPYKYTTYAHTSRPHRSKCNQHTPLLVPSSLNEISPKKPSSSTPPFLPHSFTISTPSLPLSKPASPASLAPPGRPRPKTAPRLHLRFSITNSIRNQKRILPDCERPSAKQLSSQSSCLTAGLVWESSRRRGVWRCRGRGCRKIGKRGRGGQCRLLWWLWGWRVVL